MKGALADRPLGFKLLFLLLLVVLGNLFFSAIGLGLGALLYDMDSQELLARLMSMEGPGMAKLFKLVQGFTSIGTFIVPAFVGAYLFSKQPSELLRTQSFPQPVLLTVFLVVVTGLGAGTISDLLFHFTQQIAWPAGWEAIKEWSLQSQDLMQKQYAVLLEMHNSLDFVEVLIVMAVLPALGEEALFRGLLQPLLGQWLKRHAAVFLTAFCFALLHQQITAFLSIFALGIILGYIKEWTRSLWVPSLLHMLNNALIVGAVYFFEVDYSDQQSAIASGNYSQLLLLVPFAFAMYWFWRHRESA